MIKILIVEDNSNKANNISEVLKELPGVGCDNIEVSSDIISAKRILYKKNFDLLILDIKIPNRFGQDPLRDGGIQLLESLRKDPLYFLPYHVIGITEFDDILLESKEVFESKCWYVIKYDASSRGWVDQLSNHIQYLLDSKKSFLHTIQEYRFDVAIICALGKIEFESIKNISECWSEYLVPGDPTKYFTTKIFDGQRPLDIVIACAFEMGMPASAVLSMKVINNFRPKNLIITGITAGISGQVKIGDILVADPSWDYGSGKIVEIEGEPQFQQDPMQIRLDPGIKSIVLALASDNAELNKIYSSWPGEKPENVLNVHVGPVASGSSVLADSKIVSRIIEQNRKVIGVEMETYGVYCSGQNCDQPKPKAISIKSVCDYADEGKSDKFQKYAAYTSNEFAKRLIMKLP